MAVDDSDDAKPSPSQLLTPVSAPPRSSTDATPSSPTPTFASSNEAASTIVPPSPTLSDDASVNNQQSCLALRNNHPELLTPVVSQPGRPSSTADTGTEPDISHQQPLHQTKSNVTSVTHVGSTAGHSKRSKRATLDSLASRRSQLRGRSVDSNHTGPIIDDDPTPFAFKPRDLAAMFDPKDFDTLALIGGTRKLLQGLGTNRLKGLNKAGGEQRDEEKSEKPSPSPAQSPAAVPGIVLTAPGGENEDLPGDIGSGEDVSGDGPAFKASLEERRKVFGSNTLPRRDSKTLLSLMWTAFKDKVLILLSIAALISFVLGIVQDFGPSHTPGEPRVDWVEGVAIMIAVIIVVVVGSLNDYQKERQFRTLNDKKDERTIKVLRGGMECVIDVRDVVVGDVALLEPGEIVPCDGIFLTGHNVKCDESGATGESDAIKKITFEEWSELKSKAHRQHDEAPAGHDDKDGLAHTDCFVVSGSKVQEGVGSYVVVAVGETSFNGRIMMMLRGDPENTPLQLKLNNLAELIAKIGSAAGLLLFIALMIRFFVQLGRGVPVRSASEKGFAFMDILIIAVTVVVVAVPEGLPLAVTLALAFATKRMTSENLLVRVLGSCETMANASVVCTDKTGTLTTNVMTIVAGSFGVHCKFVRQLDENPKRTNADENSEEQATQMEKHRKHPDDFSIDQSQLNDILSPQLQTLVNHSIAVNSTAFEDMDPISQKQVFIGNKTECALLDFARSLDWTPYKKVRDQVKVVQMIPFSSQRKSMGVVVALPDGRYRVYLKGASEMLCRKSTKHVVVEQSGQYPSSEEVETRPIDDLAAENLSRTIIFYANQSLRAIALCYRDFTSWPPQDVRLNEENEVEYDDLFQDLTMIGIVGIEDPLRPGVREAVGKCHKAGVTVKMCTGDNAITARSIALQCGIFTPGGIIMEGPTFRKLSDADMTEIVPRLQVLARSSPEDKKILVEKLKSLGEVVGVTGDGTNDGPALKTANVGFSMGISGTEVAKEASDIIVMDDNFASIVKAIIWGRCVNDSVRKFLQFQISTNVTAVIITFVSAVASEQEESVLTAVQLLWINIIMDTFAALALATDPASEALLDRKPDKKTAPLFSADMYKMILFQSLYQIVIILVFHFLGHKILRHDDDLVIKTLVFNAFVFAQIFNSINSRRLDRKLNIFEGLQRNWWFIGITLIEIAGQVIIVFKGGAAFQVKPLPGKEWGISLALGVVSIPLGAIVRLLPTAPFEKLFNAIGLLGKTDVLPSIRPEAEWNSTIDLVRDNLNVFGQLRGGRLRSSSFVLQSRSARPDKEDERLRLPSLMAMTPALMISSIGAGWSPQANDLSDPAGNDPSRSSAALWEGQVQIHPETPHDDAAYQKFGKNLKP
jgi:Ca2+-transporting ATPase